MEKRKIKLDYTNTDNKEIKDDDSYYTFVLPKNNYVEDIKVLKNNDKKKK